MPFAIFVSPVACEMNDMVISFVQVALDVFKGCIFSKVHFYFLVSLKFVYGFKDNFLFFFRIQRRNSGVIRTGNYYQHPEYRIKRFKLFLFHACRQP